ncbi:AlpA family transcriptional regulator [Mesorhizobium sp. M0152]|uniref:helix-turn-helix transcriptional regulator n=1 Tax=Mesorhizobium sp. M0152 TaxID=2956898 RepID=UPI00333DA845
MAERFISMDEVISRVCFSRTHIYRKIADGSFPRQVPLGGQKVAFLEREIEQWIVSRLQARDHDGERTARTERGRSLALGKGVGR